MIPVPAEAEKNIKNAAENKNTFYFTIITNTISYHFTR
jgi:hypothetical protein